MRIPHNFSASFCLLLLVSPTDVTTPIEKFSCVGLGYIGCPLSGLGVRYILGVRGRFASVTLRVCGGYVEGMLGIHLG